MSYRPIASDKHKGWYKIPGFERYLAHPTGKVMNVLTKRISSGGQAGRYLRVSAYRDGDSAPTLMYLHELICMAFHGPRPPNMVVLHLNDDKTNNTRENLAWGTQAENMRQVYINQKRPSKRYSTESIPACFIWALEI